MEKNVAFSDAGEDTLTKYKVLKNLTVISSAFFFLFTAYDGLSMLQSTMNQEGGIGTVSQAVNYVFFGISSFLLPKYTIHKLGCRTTLLVGLILYLPYIASNFYPSWFTMMPSAALSGIGGSILWGSQCTYFNESAVTYCELDTKHCPNTECDDNAVSEKEVSIAESQPEPTEKAIAKRKSKVLFNIEVEEVKTIVGKKRRTSQVKLGPKLSQDFSSGINPRELCAVKNNSVCILFPECKNSNYLVYDPSFNPEALFNPSKNKIFNPLPRLSCPNSMVAAGNIRSILRRKSIMRQVPLNTLPNVSSVESTNARFFGFHGLVYYTAQIISNLMSFFVLDMGDEMPLEMNTTFALNTSMHCSCGADFCNDINSTSCGSAVAVHDDLRTLLSGICLASGVLGALLVIFFLDPLEKLKPPSEKKEETTFSMDVILATFRHCKKKEQLLLFPICIYTGMYQGFYTADFTKSYVECAWSISHVGIVSAVYGAFCAASSTCTGLMVKYVGRVPVFVVVQIINLAELAYLILWIPDSTSPIMFYIGAALLGTIVGGYWSQLQAFCGILFMEDEEAAFASYYLCSSLGWTVAFLCSDHICTYVKVYMLAVLSTVGIIGYLITEKIFRSRQK